MKLLSAFYSYLLPGESWNSQTDGKWYQAAIWLKPLFSVLLPRAHNLDPFHLALDFPAELCLSDRFTRRVNENPLTSAVGFFTSRPSILSATPLLNLSCWSKTAEDSVVFTITPHDRKFLLVSTHPCLSIKLGLLHKSSSWGQMKITAPPLFLFQWSDLSLPALTSINPKVSTCSLPWFSQELSLAWHILA